jgi:hypothetical protein
MKKCPKCGETKSYNEFGRDKRHLDGRSSYCKICNKGLARANYLKNREARLGATRRWYEKNKKRVSESHARWYHSDEHHKIKAVFYDGARKTLKGLRSGEKWVKQVGLETAKEFINHLESTIPEGYTLNDYGRILSLDHIIPCSKFDLKNEVQREKCFHYTNLRLITKSENSRKGNKLITELETEIL